MKSLRRTSVPSAGPLLALALVLAVPAMAQELLGDYGDAPEGALAYPAAGVIGAFPTCVNVPLSTFIYHGPIGWAYFGPLVDFEPDGNAGTCPLFAPYDLDECFMDNDAGLLHPPAFTIVGTQVVPCAGVGGSLGSVCMQAIWGPTLDIHLVNTMPVVGFVNVLFDWNQDGLWAPSSQVHCSAAEHALVNFPVPPGFVGPLSALGPPPFLIGGNPDFVWSRFTISEQPVVMNWDGSGIFEDGESEDYLLVVDDSVPVVPHSWSHIKGIYR